MEELTGKRILTVDDDMNSLAVYAALLRKNGAVVLQDFWSIDTVNVAMSLMPIDIILLDLKLHFEMSSSDIFDAIKAPSHDVRRRSTAGHHVVRCIRLHRSPKR